MIELTCYSTYRGKEAAWDKPYFTSYVELDEIVGLHKEWDARGCDCLAIETKDGRYLVTNHFWEDFRHLHKYDD